MARTDALLRGEAPPAVESTPEVDVIFVDDARQKKPTRPGMGDIVAVGGISIGTEEIKAVTARIDALCTSTGFPAGDEFKWSPSANHWMRQNLVEDKREQFFTAILAILAEHDVIATVVAVDAQHKSASGADGPEMDAVTLFLERMNHQCGQFGSTSFVVVDRPAGGQKDEDEFLSSCLELLESGTRFVKFTNFAHNVLCTSSHLSRLLQCADLITSCTTARVAGESHYSPQVFEKIVPLLNERMGTRGGVGLKLHPDYRFANLYHWLVGDTHFWRLNCGTPLPLAGKPYQHSPDRL